MAIQKAEVENPYLGTEQLAKLYPFQRRTWCKWARTGQIPGAIHVRNRVLIPLLAAEEFLDRTHTKMDLVKKIAAQQEAEDEKRLALRRKIAQQEAAHGVGA